MPLGTLASIKDVSSHALLVPSSSFPNVPFFFFDFPLMALFGSLGPVAAGLFYRIL